MICNFNYLRFTLTQQFITSEKVDRRNILLPVVRACPSVMLAFILVTLFQISPAVASPKLRIGAIGDSYSSGEGSPDASISTLLNMNEASRQAALWHSSPDGTHERETDDDCHRSKLAWPYQVGDSVRARSRKEVDFSSFACSGAQIPHLITDTFKKVGCNSRSSFVDNLAVGGQLCEIENRFSINENSTSSQLIDALIFTIGGNDVGFSNAVQHCLLAPSCDKNPLLSTRRQIDIDAGKNTLRERYIQLAKAVEQVNRGGKVYIANVFVVGYPNPMTDEKNRYCNPLLPTTTFPPIVTTPGMPVTKPTFDFLDTITGSESKWGSEKVIPALNDAVREGSQRFSDDPYGLGAGKHYGWFVSGVMDAFKGHGYCSNSRWINIFRDSITEQGSYIGVVHPNVLGQNAYRDVVAPELDRIIAPDVPQLSVANIGFPNNQLLLKWSQSNTTNTKGYQVAHRPAQRGGQVLALNTPAPKWPESFGSPPRHLGSNDPDWVFDTSVISGMQSFQAVPSEPADYVVRACNEGMCSRWSEPVRIVGSFGSRPIPANVSINKESDRSVRVNWTARPVAVNTFTEVSLSSGNQSPLVKQVPSGQSQIQFMVQPFSTNSVSVRECMWSVVGTGSQRNLSRCSVWTTAVSLSLAPPQVRQTRPEQIKESGANIQRPAIPQPNLSPQNIGPQLKVR